MEDTGLLTEEIPVSAKTSSFNCEAEGFKYVAGYVAHKFLPQFPDLGQKTCDIFIWSKTPAPWITALSRGGLVVPSERFMSQVYDMEKIFTSIHGASISSEAKVILKFHSLLIKNFPNLSADVLGKYARTRTFIRIRFLNYQLKVDQVKYCIINFCATACKT